MLQEYCRLNDQMEHREYYSALKTLELLEHTYLPRVRGYIFSELLSTEIPKIRNSIQNQSRAELTVSDYYRITLGAHASKVYGALLVCYTSVHMR